MTVTLRINSRFPDSPYQLFRRGLLDSWLGLPLTSRVDVVAGDAFIAHATGMSDEATVSHALAALVNAERGDPAAKNWDVDIAAPTLTPCHLVDVERFHETGRDGVRVLRPGDLVLTLAITRPGSSYRHLRPDVPFYLHIDRVAPQPTATLHLRGIGHATWTFGETIHLPEPFGFSISTADWRPESVDTPA